MSRPVTRSKHPKKKLIIIEKSGSDETGLAHQRCNNPRCKICSICDQCACNCGCSGNQSSLSTFDPHTSEESSIGYKKTKKKSQHNASSDSLIATNSVNPSSSSDSTLIGKGISTTSNSSTRDTNGGALTNNITNSSVISDVTSHNSGTGNNREINQVNGNNSGTGHVSGDNSGTGHVSGNNSGTGHVSHANSGTGHVSGNNSGTGHVSHINSGSGQVSGNNSGTGHISGNNSGTGQVSGTAGISGNNSGTGHISGNNSGTGQVSGTADISSNNSGTGHITGNHSGTGHVSYNSGTGPITEKHSGTGEVSGTARVSISSDNEMGGSVLSPLLLNTEISVNNSQIERCDEKTNPSLTTRSDNSQSGNSRQSINTRSVPSQSRSSSVDKSQSTSSSSDKTRSTSGLSGNTQSDNSRSGNTQSDNTQSGNSRSDNNPSRSSQSGNSQSSNNQSVSGNSLSCSSQERHVYICYNITNSKRKEKIREYFNENNFIIHEHNGTMDEVVNETQYDNIFMVSASADLQYNKDKFNTKLKGLFDSNRLFNVYYFNVWKDNCNKYRNSGSDKFLYPSTPSGSLALFCDRKAMDKIKSKSTPHKNITKIIVSSKLNACTTKKNIFNYSTSLAINNGDFKKMNRYNSDCDKKDKDGGYGYIWIFFMILVFIMLLACFCRRRSY